MRKAIIEKLNLFLNSHMPIREENEAVYVMVETRKILDRIRGNDNTDPSERNRLIRFYGDWTVHTRINNTPAIIEYMRMVNTSLASGRQDLNLDFLSLLSLNNAMRTFYEENGITTSLFINDDYWNHFVDVFIQVLADQPIINPINEIGEFYFVPGNIGTRTVTITFTDNRGSKTVGIDSHET